MIKKAVITDKLVIYFIEHGKQILTGFAILVAGLILSRWMGNVA